MEICGDIFIGRISLFVFPWHLKKCSDLCLTYQRSKWQIKDMYIQPLRQNWLYLGASAWLPKIMVNFSESLHLLHFFKIPSPQHTLSIYFAKRLCRPGMRLMRVPRRVHDLHHCLGHLTGFHLGGLGRGKTSHFANSDSSSRVVLDSFFPFCSRDFSRQQTWTVNRGREAKAASIREHGFPFQWPRSPTIYKTGVDPGVTVPVKGQAYTESS